jgi:hypothetical protein
VPFVALTAIGSVSGAAFSHYLLFPSMMSFLATFTLAEIKFVPRVEYVFELYRPLGPQETTERCHSGLDGHFPYTLT